jgi:hypothetical protein
MTLTPTKQTLPQYLVILPMCLLNLYACSFHVRIVRQMIPAYLISQATSLVSHLSPLKSFCTVPSAPPEGWVMVRHHRSGKEPIATKSFHCFNGESQI